MKNLLFFIILLNYTYSNSQNVIPNYSFEDMESGDNEKPRTSNQLEFLKEWVNLNTSDLFSTEPDKFAGRFDPVNSISGPNCYTLGPYTMTANHQNKYIGIGPCEGAKVKFMNGNKLEKGQWAKIKLHYAFRGNNTTTNLVLALSNDFSNGDVYNSGNNSNQNNNNDCENLDLPGIEIIKFYELTTASDKVPGLWYELETYIFNENNESMDNFYILGNNVTSNIYGFSSNYIFIDNVSLEILDFCEHPCAYSNGDAKHSTLPNAMVGNCSGCTNQQGDTLNNFKLLIENVNHFKFTVWSDAGGSDCVVHTQDIYSLHPLSDFGYSDWLFIWNGFANNSSFCSSPTNLPSDGYTYMVELYSCSGSDLIEIQFIALLGILNPPAYQPPLPNFNVSESCCPNERYIQNTTFETAQNYKHKVDEFILIGPDVNPSPFVQNGDVIFEPRTNVLFEAGKYVEFIPGVNGLNGPIDIDMDLNTALNNNVTVNIKPCISPNRNSGGNRDNFAYSNEKLIINNLDPLSNNNLIELYPTVTSNIFKLKSSLFNIEKVEIIDNKGKIVQTEIKSFKETEIDCNALSGGFYFVRLFMENGSTAFKKVVKVDLD